jgi:hypothetical protein
MPGPIRVRRVAALSGGLIAVGCALLWGARTYPQELTGTWTNVSTPGHTIDDTMPITLTLRSAGQGYLKVSDVPEQQITWSADENKVVVHLSGGADVLTNLGSSDVVATLSPAREELKLDLGSVYPLRHAD